MARPPKRSVTKENAGKFSAISEDEVVDYPGTTNFDCRSRLYNSEMGYFFHAGPLAEDLGSVFEDLKARSYRWGSPEWLQMRKNLMELGGVKGRTLRMQRTIFKTLRATGLEWQF